MAVLFSAREIAEAAVEKEKKRRGFYATVSELSTNEGMKELFQFLTEEEDKHVAAFAQIRDNLPEDAHSEEYTADMQAYMDSVVDDRLYSTMDSKEFVRQAITTRNVFRLAIGFEKDAILYFREFLPYLTEAERKVVSELIEQEKGHIRKLAEMEKRLAPV
jgi:rubrerythrin